MLPSNQNFLNRVKIAVDPSNQIASDTDWIQKNTTIKGKAFSFKHHEYQLPLLNCKNRIKYCKKCSQLGISEIAVRRMLAKSLQHLGVTSLYALPTAKFASKFGSTRVQTAIDSSAAAKEALYKTDSAEVRRFFNESYIYMQGCSTSSQVISIPVDFLIIDEKDFAESQALVSSLNSRLTHSSYKDQFHFSTPTVSNYGITSDFDNSLQHVEIQKCCHCNHTFVPDYYKNVALPGFNRPGPGHALKYSPEHINAIASTFAKEFTATEATFDGAFRTALTTPEPPARSPFDRQLSEIGFLTRSLLKQFDVNTAYLECPSCKRPVDQALKYREWIRVNEASFSSPNSLDTPVGFHISPFSAPQYTDPVTGMPNGVPPSQMILNSTTYVDMKDFVNYCLGLEYDDATTGFSEQELRDLFTDKHVESQIAAPTPEDPSKTTTISTPMYPDAAPPFTVAGMDMGGTCARITAYPAPDGHLRITHLERIPLTRVTQRHLQLNAQHKTISSVADAMPYTDTIRALQDKDHRIFGCMFTNSKSLSLYSVRDIEENEEKATFGLRQLNAKRDALLDFALYAVRKGMISIVPNEQNLREMQFFIDQMRDSKRIKLKPEFSTDTQETKGVYSWKKSVGGEDHYFLALAYMILANFIKGLHNNSAPLPFVCTKIKVTTNL